MTFEALGPDGEVTARDARTARLLALHVPEGAAPTPFLPPGRFRAVFEGTLAIDFLDDYDFALEGRGRARLEVDGETVIDARGEKGLAAAPQTTVELDAGPRPVRLVYESPAEGPARVRVLWASFDFRREPVPPRVLHHDPDRPLLRRGARLRRGRALVAELRCLACHRPGRPARFVEGMPELGRPGPSLVDLGARLRTAWVTRWVADPRSLRPDARMPRLLAGRGGPHGPGPRGRGGPERRGREGGRREDRPRGRRRGLGPPTDAGMAYRRARHVAAYLTRPGTPGEEEAGDAATGASGPASPERGARLFRDLGCHGCHVLTPEDDATDLGMRAGLPARVSLARVDAKFREGALAAFLRDPHGTRPAARMPDFRLTAGEARDLAAHLRAAAKPPPDDAYPAFPGADPERGQAIVERFGCLRCHEGPGEDRSSAPSWEAVLAAPADTGCLAAETSGASPRAAAPEFGLPPEDRAALRAFLDSGADALTRAGDVEYAQRTVERLRCRACHARDGRRDLRSLLDARAAGSEPGGAEPRGAPGPPASAAGSPQDLDDAAATARAGAEGPPRWLQTRPRLTWTGAKFRTRWLTRFLAGEEDTVIRPWLRARMPRFALDAGRLARGLAREHGIAPGSTPCEATRTPPRDEVLTAGERLIGRDGGLACVTCHDLAGEPARAAFDARAPDLVPVPERMRPAFWDRWLRDPQRVAPGTRMPTFAVDGRSPVPDVLDGDAQRQFDAIRAWLLHRGRTARSAPGPGSGDGTR